MHTDAFIVGATLVLRPVRESDAKYLMQWVNNPEVRQFLLNRVPQSMLSEKEWIAKVAKIGRYPESITLMMEPKSLNKPIGIIGLHNINWIDRNATTGSMIGDLTQQGKGYAVDAKMHLLKYTFEILGMHKVISRAIAENERSIRYSERCGYVREAVLKDEIFRGGAWGDMVQLACYYETWLEKWNEYVKSGFNFVRPLSET